MTFVKFPYPCQVINNTAGTVLDDYGNAIANKGTVNTYCDLQQTKTDEPERQGERSMTTWDLFLPEGTVIDTSDIVKVKGLTYEVIGDPWNADTGSRDVNHLEVVVAREGAG